MTMFSLPASLVCGGGRIIGVAISSARICTIVMLLSFVLTESSLAAAPQASPPPEKVDQLIELLSDPAIKSWLKEQVTSDRQKQAAAGVDTTQHPMLSNTLASIREHAQSLLSAIPELPAQIERARTILSNEFETTGLLGILALIFGFVAAGFGLDRLARYLLRGYLAWMKTLDFQTPHGRVKALGARAIYAAILIAAFIVGSAGVFLAFDWPPLLREIVLGYLSVAIVTRVALMLGRLVLLPPHLKMAQAAEARLLPMNDESAAHWYRYIGWNVFWFSFVGVTLGLLATLGFKVTALQLFAVPADFIQLVIVLAAIWLRSSAAEVEQLGTPSSPRTASWLFTAFFVVLWLLRVSGSYLVFWLVLVLVAVPAGVVIAQRMVHHLLRPPAKGTEARLVPPITIALVDRGLRVVIIVGAALFLARIWNLDLGSMTQGESTSTRLLRGGLNATVILLAADFGWSLVKALIAHKFRETELGEASAHAPASIDQRQARLRTLLPIVQNMLFAVIAVIAVLMALSSLGIEIGPLIAGAGIAGVALGFGAQTLVKDVIAGIFYLLDDAFRVGEYIQSGNYRGTVESFSLRSVKLRHQRGALFTVPFGELGAVQNMSRDWVIDKLMVGVTYDTDLDKVKKIIKQIGQELLADPEFAPYIIETLKMQGVEQFGDFAIQIRMKMMTKPGEQFVIRRKAYALIKKAFDANHIAFAFPTVTVAGGGDPAAAVAQKGLEIVKPPTPISRV
jgi:small-conductance mechanosensitive channel